LQPFLSITALGLAVIIIQNSLVATKLLKHINDNNIVCAKEFAPSEIADHEYYLFLPM